MCRVCWDGQGLGATVTFAESPPTGRGINASKTSDLSAPCNISWLVAFHSRRVEVNHDIEPSLYPGTHPQLGIMMPFKGDGRVVSRNIHRLSHKTKVL